MVTNMLLCKFIKILANWEGEWYYTNVWHLGYPNSGCYPNTRVVYTHRLPESVKCNLLFVIVLVEVAIFNEKNLIF